MSEKKIYNAIDISKYIIDKTSKVFISEDVKEGITNLKLQKILYFCQAYFLGKYGRRLFKEEIEAWKYGPVVREVYNEFKKNANNPITGEYLNEINIEFEDMLDIEKVCDDFSGYSTGRLVKITHDHKPWRETYDEKKQGKIIDTKLIESYYKGLFI